MNKNHLFSATPAPCAGFRNLHAASWSRRLASIASILIVSLSLCHAAQSFTLTWDASSDPTVAGYKVRYGTTSENPSQTIDVGKKTTVTVSNLNDGTTYYFKVASYTAAGVESQASDDISYTTAEPVGRTYVLTVINGTGGGNYAPGAQVAVSVNAPPPGQQFAGWTEDYQILANPSSPTTTAIIPSVNTRITATYTAATTPTAEPTSAPSVASVTLAWDASSDPNIAGYKLRYGTTSGDPSQTVDVGKTTTATVPNLNHGRTYYFTVIAYDAAGVESQHSNEASHTAKPSLAPAF